MHISISKYTEDVFLATYPEATKEDYINHLYRSENGFGLLDTIKQMEKEYKQTYTSIRMVPLTSAFLQHLKKKNLTNNETERLKYITTISDEVAEAIWYSQEISQATTEYTRGCCRIHACR